ncbi:MAG: energy transducer TonB [Bacteroidales bacterium]
MKFLFGSILCIGISGSSLLMGADIHLPEDAVVIAGADSLTSYQIINNDYAAGKSFNHLISTKVYYPEIAELNHIGGRVMVSFKINEYGRPVQSKVESATHLRLNTELLRVVNRIPTTILKEVKLKQGEGPFLVSVDFVSENQDTTKTVDKLAQYPGGTAAYRAFMNENATIPLLVGDKTIKGSAMVCVDVTETGQIMNPEILKSSNPQINAEALRMVGLIDSLIPAKRYGKDVASKYVFQVRAGDKFKEAAQNDSSDILMSVDIMPEFPGGKKALLQYIRENIRYPVNMIRIPISGDIRVIASFVIDKDGTVTDPMIVRSPLPGSEFDEEALRLLNEMPAWTPGYQGGKPVRVRHTLPFTFRKTAGKTVTKRLMGTSVRF